MNEPQSNPFKKNYKLPKTGSLEAAIKAFSPIEKTLLYVFGGLFAISALVLAFLVSNSFIVNIPTDGGTLTEGIIGTPQFINPLFAVSDSDTDLTALVYSGLMKTDGNGGLMPDLASSYTVSPDGRTYTFTLKSNAYFQDGTPVTADDVVFTVQEAQDPTLKSARQANWAGVTVTKVSDKVVSFTLPQAYEPFLENTTMGILPKHIWANIASNAFALSNNNIDPVGSGPYKIIGINRDSSGIPTSYDLQASSNYVFGEPYITNLVLKFYSDENTEIAAYKNGDIDSLNTLSPENMDGLDTSASTIEKTPLPRVFGVFFNQNQNPLFTDKQVKEALNEVVDRNAIIQTVLNGYGVPITGPIPSDLLINPPTATSTVAATVATMVATSTSTTTPAAKTTTTTSKTTSTKTVTTKTTTSKTIATTAKVATSTSASAASAAATAAAPALVPGSAAAFADAKSILAKDGWVPDANGNLYKATKTGTTTLAFTLSTANSPELLAVAEILKETWAKLGVQVTVQSFELGDLDQTVIRPRNYDALLFGEVVGRDLDLYTFWDSAERNDPGLNIALYTNTKVDSYVEALRTTLDPVKRFTLLNEFNAQIQSDIPAIFIYSPDLVYIIPKDLQNFSMNDVDDPSERFATISSWYIDTERVWKIFIHGQNTASTTN